MKDDPQSDWQGGAARPGESRQEHDQDLTVLLADDDLRCRDSLAQLLATEGFRILSAAGGQEVLDVLRSDLGHGVLPGHPVRLRPRVHFLVLDYEMPDLNGLEVLRVVRQEFRLRLPAILVTGRAADLELERTVRGEEALQDAFHHGVFALAGKPVEPVSFRRLVWELMTRGWPEASAGD